MERWRAFFLRGDVRAISPVFELLLAAELTAVGPGVGFRSQVFGVVRQDAACVSAAYRTYGHWEQRP